MASVREVHSAVTFGVHQLVAQLDQLGHFIEGLESELDKVRQENANLRHALKQANDTHRRHVKELSGLIKSAKELHLHEHGSDSSDHSSDTLTMALVNNRISSSTYALYRQLRRVFASYKNTSSAAIPIGQSSTSTQPKRIIHFSPTTEIATISHSISKANNSVVSSSRSRRNRSGTSSIYRTAYMLMSRLADCRNCVNNRVSSNTSDNQASHSTSDNDAPSR